MFALAFVGFGVSATPMTLSANFDSPSGAAPQTTAARTVTVPPSNSGRFRMVFTGAGGAPSPRRSINGGTFVVFSDGDLVTMANGETLAFRNTAAASNISIQLYDFDTGVAVGTPFTITCS